MNPMLCVKHQNSKLRFPKMLLMSVHFYFILGYASIFLLATCYGQDEWKPDDVLERIPLQYRDALSPDISVGEPLTEREQIALSNAILFIPQELWFSSAIKVPFRRVPGTSFCGDEPEDSSATIYIVQYMSRTYGIVVLQDVPDGLYSSWIVSPDESPLTGRKEIPFFYYSVGDRPDKITEITPSKDLAGGPLAGLGDDGSGGLDADNGFRADSSGRGYWPLYLRGYLASGGKMPYSSIPFGQEVRTVLSEEEQSQIPSQRFNYLDTESDVLVKIAYHSDGVLHGWVPGDPGQFEVRFQLHARDIERAVRIQAPKMMEVNRDAGRTGGLKWDRIGIRPPNRAPRAGNDQYNVIEGTTLRVPAHGVLANDTDMDDGMVLRLDAVLASGPSGGTLVCPFTGENEVCLNGAFAYTPDPGTISDSFTYFATDGNRDSTVATVNLNVISCDGIPPSQPSRRVDVRVNSRNDDAEEAASGSVNTGSSDLELVNDGGNQTVGIRFRDVDIPQGATILSAYVEFTIDEVNSGPVNLIITGENSDSAPGFIRDSFNISSRAQTVEVLWIPSAWSTVGVKERTVDISPVIQEIVNRSGWRGGNDLTIIIKGTGAGKRVAVSYNANRSQAPILQVEYE